MPLGKTIAFLGAGNMAEALVKGMLRAHVAEPGEIICSDRAEERGPELIERYGIRPDLVAMGNWKVASGDTARASRTSSAPGGCRRADHPAAHN